MDQELIEELVCAAEDVVRHRGHCGRDREEEEGERREVRTWLLYDLAQTVMRYRLRQRERAEMVRRRNLENLDP